MQKFNKSQIKRALSRIREERLENWRRSQLPGRIPADQRALEKLFTSYLTKTGFPFKEFHKIRAHSETEMRRLLKKQKADAIRHSYSVKKTLRRGIDGLRATIGQLVATEGGSAGPPCLAQLVTPFLIWPTHGLYLDSTNIQPWNNWAKIKLDLQDPKQALEELSFYFFWQNPSDQATIIDVQSSLALNGSYDLHSNWGLLSGALLAIQTSLVLFEWWNQPPTEPVDENDLRQIPVNVQVGPNLFDDTKAQAINGNYDLRYSLFPVPPGGVAVFEVVLTILVLGFGGYDVHVDFLSGAYQVLCPAVVLTCNPLAFQAQSGTPVIV